ncbi:hypothetical protein [uncultured Sunxiuqinia sp.]|uniref:hypothetical protein n=1 Tax=uncultured Sunxiuqinia sp. TaxID=1573825 RepID=UPI0030D9785A|tara:strand:- start:37249 stop:37464 length:216 start_codon:yes stop_codon:yes gene_type:complete
MSVFAIEHDDEYALLVERLESSVNKNAKKLKGKEKTIEKNLDQVELALHELFGNKQFDKTSFLKLKLQNKS